MSGRQSRGRQRIPMRRIYSPDDLYATFSKRRIGLYKKASELSTLCGADVGVVIFSPTNNPFSFWNPSPESVIERYQNPNHALDDQARAIDVNTRARIEYLNMRLDEVLDEKDVNKEREKQIDEIGQNRPKGWWDEIPIDGLSEEQLREWKSWFQLLNSNVKTRIDYMETLAMFNPGPSSGPSMVRPSQFLGNFYNNVPQQAQLSFCGDGTSHYNDSLYGGNSFNQFHGLFNHFP